MPNPRLGQLYPSNIAEGYRSLYNSDTPFSDYAQGAKGLLSNAAENLVQDNEAIQRGDVETVMKFALPFAGGMAVKPTFTAGLPKHIESLYPTSVAKEIGYRMMSNKGKIDPDFALRNIIRDKLGSGTAIQEKDPQKLFELYNSVRPALGGKMESIKQYRDFLARDSAKFGEQKLGSEGMGYMTRLSEIPPVIKEKVSVPMKETFKRIQNAYPQIFGQGANIGNTLKKVWQSNYSDMKFGDFMQKLKAKADSIVNNPAEAEGNKGE